MHEESCFVTLTYDADHVPKDGSLSVKACQDFLKRLRERVRPVRIRFFLCGEYGERLARPHYHAIIFGWEPPDRKRLPGHFDYAEYSSELLSEIWGHGNVHVGGVSFDSASYVANYATKKISGEKAEAHYGGRRPEFLLMSRRPGIGRWWIEEFAGDVYPADEVIVRGVQARPPRYYDQVVEARCPELLRGVKEKRERAAEVLEETVTSAGNVVRCAPSKNARRLAVRKVVAEAKFSLKRRKLEG